MKTVSGLLLCLFLAVTGAFAQQQPAGSQPDSKAATAPKPAKKSTAKKKGPKVQQVRREEKEAIGEAETENRPPLLTERLSKLARTVPVNGGLSGPDGAAEAAFEQRAYPDSDIPLERILGARAGHAAIAGRNFRDDRPGRWESFGPSFALYPFTPIRNFQLYLPNAYPAASRTPSMALSSHCQTDRCTLWIGPAGGGVWRTRDALDDEPRWEYLSSVFEINSVGAIEMDPNDPDGDTLWVGTGEANACSSGCEAGVGLYKSTDGGDHWKGPIGKGVFNARGIGSIVVKPGDPNTLYVATTRAIRGYTSVCCDGVVSLTPGAAKWGLYKSTDGGQTWTFIHNGSSDPTQCTGDVVEAGNGTPCSPRGVRRVAIDPSDENTVYASSYARGVWRSTDAGATWTQISPSLNATNTTTRPEFAVTKLPNGNTRMYLAEGNVGTPFARFSRSDDAKAATPTFTPLSSANPADSGYGSFNYCNPQCWYDNYVKTPAGNPDMVYLLGAYSYNEAGNISNARAVMLSTDAGVSFTDMTMDSTDPVQPNGIHPDQHFIVVNPNNPLQFWESSDGGVIRSSGAVANISANCSTRGLSGAVLTRCQQLLSRVPTKLTGVNKGLTTLQFQSLSVNPFDPNDLQGGTQDNGTWETVSSTSHSQWDQTIFGDGGQSGFDIANPQFRFHTYTGPEMDVNFMGGVMSDWNFIGDTFFIFPEPSQFYIPIISDPKVSQTMFAGTGDVWRTKTQGVGARSLADFRANCNEFVGVDPAGTCGDWVPLGSLGQLIGTGYGADRTGGNGVAALARTVNDTSTLWVGTTPGRVLISKNADAEPETSVTFTRLDSLAPNSPGRFISSIFVDANDGNRAWISYDGYSASTPTTPGHVFEVRYDPVAGTATWKDLSFDLADIPIAGVVRDEVTHDLFASSDFGVYRLVPREKSWRLAAPGMPNIEVAGLTLVPKANRLFAASHGQGAWLLRLPESRDDDDDGN
ncbi:MAG: sialidase family protein [Candidatus Acidiferrales bacterium]